MFFFNIVGEEILWRGYLQRRLSARNGWLICACLWWMFHLPFGLDLMIMLLPVTIIVPYVFHKTQSTLACVFIHGMYNGPLFIAIALGVMA
ncbi:CPBP family intramembrane glutamic endopeptidase [Roseinatronobacter sp. S2]|uniref:CPBP family intramembrane glutamic endopeptidase n=1 Tax=Roseinatronobacter sp. S2 TaxID=3035471 RepID=UPI00358FC330